MTMTQLPRRDAGELPMGLSLEKPANGLASLTLTDTLSDITDHVINQWNDPERFADLAEFGIFPTKQMLFYGPPGNGKTTACQWIAMRLAVPLYRVRCEALISSYIGQSAANIGRVMDWLETQDTCVVLLDEVESIFPSRTLMNGVASREIGSTMTVFWQRLDRWTGPHLFVMATNMIENLDAAMLSRIELKLEFGPPTIEQCRAVLSYWVETLHEYGSEHWGKTISKFIDTAEKRKTVHPFLSFRELWQTISKSVLNHVK